MRNLDYKKLNELRTELGDSFYILDQEKFIQNYDQFLLAFQNIYQKTAIGYSYKTNYTPALCNIVNSKGGYAEVVSHMEYDLAIKIGVHPSKIIVNGPYHTQNDIRRYLLNDSIVNLDSNYELEYLKSLVKEFPNHNFKIGLRCNFNIKNDFTSRFGFDVESDEFKSIIKYIDNQDNLILSGIHCHFPDRKLDLYQNRVRMMLHICKTLLTNLPAYIDIGGGYYGRMPADLSNQFSSTTIPTFEDYAKLIATEFREEFKNLNDDKKPLLILEPGSALVADILIFATSIIDIKKVNGNEFIAMTAGSKMNMGPMSSTINMPMSVYSGVNENQSNFFEKIDISGFTCIENDYLYTNYSGYICQNDILTFSNIGSYSVVFKPPFILPNCPIISIDFNDKIQIIKRQETTDDIFNTFIFNFL